MLDKIFEVYKSGQGEVEEKKSRFLAECIRIKSEADVKEQLDKLRKKHFNARHICYAYIIDDIPIIKRCSDDGEPSQTAGKPILEVLEHSRIQNALITVVRYFGGTLLGTGGLTRAYRKAAEAALTATEIFECKEGKILTIVCDYQLQGKIDNYIRNSNALVTETDFAEDVRISCVVEKDNTKKVISDIENLTNAKVNLTLGDSKKFGMINKEIIIL